MPSALARLAFVLALVALCTPVLAQEAAGPLAAAAPSARDSVTSEARFLVLTDGRMLTGDVRFMPSSLDARYALHDGERVELFEIDRAQTDAGTFGLVRHPSFNLPMLLRETSRARISLYEEANVGYSADLRYFRKDDGPLLLMNQENLEAALTDRSESLRYLRQRHRYRSVGIASLVVGAALVATGAALQFAPYDAPSALLSPAALAGTGVAFATAVNVTVPLLRRRAAERAVAAYNR